MATAPQLAARDAGVRVERGVILAAHARLAARADIVVVEGVGGWMAPLADDLEQATLARAFDASVVLVVGLRLGCLNHAQLSARAIEGDGCRLVAWIANVVDREFDQVDDYLGLLRVALPAPCLGVLPHAPGVDTHVLARELELPVSLLSWW
jgi:dethiobiotin synthetase